MDKEEVKNLCFVLIGIFLISSLYALTINLALKEFSETKIYKAANVILDKTLEEE